MRKGLAFVLNVQTGKVLIHTYSMCCVTRSPEKNPGTLPIKAIQDPAGSLTARFKFSRDRFGTTSTPQAGVGFLVVQGPRKETMLERSVIIGFEHRCPGDNSGYPGTQTSGATK
jgi:hypothetical protein